MSIFLSDGTTTVELHRDLYWSDEHMWNPVAQSAQPTITGALDVQAASLKAGRPITLEPEDESSSWMHVSVIEQLRNFAAVPLKPFQLTINGVTRSVIFRHHDGLGVEAKPLIHYNDRKDEDWFFCTVRLMEI